MASIKPKLKKISIFLIATIVVIGTFSFSSVDFKVSKSLDTFFSFFREVSIFYVDKPDPEKLVKVAIDAMLESLDPYNEFIPEENKAELEFQTTGEYGGMGALIRQSTDHPIIAEVYEGSPAHNAGLLAGDKILEINGTSVFNLPVDRVSKMLKGIPKSDIELIVQRYSEPDSLKYSFKRDKIHIPSVPYHGMVSDGMGYIRLSNFTANCHKEVESALKDLNRNNAQGIILDLRGNPGGLLNEAVSIVNLFVAKDELVVYTRGQIKEFDQEYKTTSRPVDTKIPLVVLVDRISASASEIVAGALQDLDRAIIIGERTFGKGLVQATRPLPYNAQLKITTAKYYIPSGRCIQAVDFTQRADDGSISFIPDSLISEFKTRNGRTVRDGGGITPDIEHSVSMYSRLSSVLYARNLLFDYATRFYLKHNTIESPNEFALNDEQYDDFIAFLNELGFEYESQTESVLNELVKVSEQEKYYDMIQSLTDSLKAQIKGKEVVEMEAFKPEIKKLLEEEIIGRYYLQRGKAKYGITNDMIIPKSVDILKNIDKYTSILVEPQSDTDLGEQVSSNYPSMGNSSTINRNMLVFNPEHSMQLPS
jgi:carboxyl-terminal processing protease